MEDICRIPELDDVNRSIRPTGIIGPNLPDSSVKPLEQLGALVTLADLSLVKGEAELLLNRKGKALQRLKRIDKPHEPLRWFRHYFILC